MPTARELLEQADALMRRNRGRDSVQRPVAPATAPAVESAAAPDFPVLTDVVEVATPVLAASPARPATPVAEPSDVPVLTEAVEAIEVAPLVAEAEQGEPSFWVDSPDEDKSVLGAAPDSVAVVPPPDLRARGEGAVSTTVAIVDERPQAAIAEPAAPVHAATLPLPEPVAEPETEPEVEIVEAAPPPAAEPETALALELESDLQSEPVRNTELELEPEPESEPEPEPALDMAPEPVARQFVTPLAVPVVSMPLAVPAAVEAAQGAGPADEERWRQLAEDVRMQVLQRIDMFTDTGLHEQLGQRLKPIVDRASADLVATINQHVGELLRSYVAEAIEREIERWRHDGER